MTMYPYSLQLALMEGSPLIPFHAHGRGAEVSGASRRAFHYLALPDEMAELGFLVSSVVNLQ